MTQRREKSARKERLHVVRNSRRKGELIHFLVLQLVHVCLPDGPMDCTIQELLTQPLIPLSMSSMTMAMRSPSRSLTPKPLFWIQFHRRQLWLLALRWSPSGLIMSSTILGMLERSRMASTTSCTTMEIKDGLILTSWGYIQVKVKSSIKISFNL